MALFNFFRTPRHQQYKYIPRYYDPDKEELDARLKKAGLGGYDDSSPEAIKGRMQVGFKRRQSVDPKLARKLRRQANLRVTVISALLVLLAIYLLWANIEGILRFAE